LPFLCSIKTEEDKSKSIDLDFSRKSSELHLKESKDYAEVGEICNVEWKRKLRRISSNLNKSCCDGLQLVPLTSFLIFAQKEGSTGILKEPTFNA
jgi:hypothetical protein